MSDQDGRQADASPRPAPEDSEGWKAYWRTLGQPWRTEREIAIKRQEELTQRRAIVTNIGKGIHPFKAMKLTRADVEWLLATHEDGRGRVDWSDESQREREGLDLRGADLCQVDLSDLPLARLNGGLKQDEWENGIREQQARVFVLLKEAILDSAHLEGSQLSIAHLEGADLGSAQLQKAVLRNAHFQGAHLTLAHLEGADLGWAEFQKAVLPGAQLQGANLYGAKLEETDLRDVHFERADLRDVWFERANLRNAILADRQHIGPRLADTQWGNVNLSVLNWSQVKILGDEYVAQQKRDSEGKIKDKQMRLSEYEDAVRANRQLAIILRNQGLNEVADRFAYRARVLQWHVLHWQLPEQLEQVQPHPQQQETEQQKANEGAKFNLPRIFTELLDWPSSLLLEVAHPLQKTPLLEVFLLTLQLLALLYLVVPVLCLLISLPFICIWLLELLLSLVARMFPRRLAKLGYKQQQLQPLPLPLTREHFKTSVSSVIRQAGVLLTMFFKTLNVHFSSLGSLLLDLLAGHGYKSGRTIIWYLLTIGGFAWAYFHLGPTEGHPFSPSGALVFSVTSFHGRGFFPGTLSLEDTITKLAAAEAVIGLFIEISFIATFTQRFFGK